MSTKLRLARTSASLMSAFRTAHRAKDARKDFDLRDSGGDRVMAGRRASARAQISERELQLQVQLDLGNLLNTVNLASSQDLSLHPEVQRSILNYGIPDISHRTIDEGSVDDIVSELEVAIRRFEPRIIGRSIVVRRDTTIDTAELKVRFLVAAEISMHPDNIPVEFVADIEVDNPKFIVRQL
jgi:type VI secretion system protein ImpF